MLVWGRPPSAVQAERSSAILSLSKSLSFRAQRATFQGHGFGRAFFLGHMVEW